MGKGAKLTKLKSSVMKKWNSFSKLGRSISDTSSSKIATKTSGDGSSFSSSSSDSSSNLLRMVYVGKTRRRYLVSPDIIENPVFMELVSPESAVDTDAVIVECEVVLFEHLLWMLENLTESAPESLHEFAQYYSCA
ncbi:auxin-responsive protein SAUR78-like [Impatiens glandulifera]|uniref:auxin-responsive protein SAUR78-like n=1 Tax=Impatiens glandulifera TaxID=253017 RepID=UPI001FB1508B|nr:auxin-responsive protein SAUR78-like [Impatiens glandulifera]